MHHSPKKAASLVRKAALICIIRKPGCTYASDRNPDALTHPTGIRMHLCIHLESGCTYASAWTTSIAYMFCFSEKGIFNRRSRNPLKRIVSRSLFLQIIMFFISSFSL